MFYSTDLTFTAIQQRLMEKAAEAGISDRFFVFAFPAYSEPKPNLAADLVLRAKMSPARLVITFEGVQLDVLYDAMRAEGMWMPRYQILSNFWHVRTRVQTRGIMEMAQTPIHYILTVPDRFNNQTAQHRLLWDS